MKNIILLPLDERPCNFDFPSKIFNGEKYTIIRPEHLGQKKTRRLMNSSAISCSQISKRQTRRSFPSIRCCTAA